MMSNINVHEVWVVADHDMLENHFVLLGVVMLKYERTFLKLFQKPGSTLLLSREAGAARCWQGSSWCFLFTTKNSKEHTMKTWGPKHKHTYEQKLIHRGRGVWQLVYIYFGQRWPLASADQERHSYLDTGTKGHKAWKTVPGHYSSSTKLYS